MQALFDGSRLDGSQIIKSYPREIQPEQINLMIAHHIDGGAIL